jgi:hypothetical protein
VYHSGLLLFTNLHFFSAKAKAFAISKNQAYKWFRDSLIQDERKITQLAHLIATQAEAAIGKTNDTNFDAKSHCCVASR